MSFKIDDRVTWVTDGEIAAYVPTSDAVGTITDVDHARERVYVQWDNGHYGWILADGLKFVDVVTRLGDVAS